MLDGSAALQAALPALIAKAYVDARKRASILTGLPMCTFPETPNADFDRMMQAALREDD
jgi:hypothetical protein